MCASGAMNTLFYVEIIMCNIPYFTVQYTPSRTLRSTTDTRKLKIPLFKKKYSGQRSFSYQGPVIWNNLPFSIRHTHTLLI